jgi:hypothetical protein
MQAGSGGGGTSALVAGGNAPTVMRQQHRAGGKCQRREEHLQCAGAAHTQAVRTAHASQAQAVRGAAARGTTAPSGAMTKSAWWRANAAGCERAYDLNTLSPAQRSTTLRPACVSDAASAAGAARCAAAAAIVRRAPAHNTNIAAAHASTHRPRQAGWQLQRRHALRMRRIEEIWNRQARCGARWRHNAVHGGQEVA